MTALLEFREKLKLIYSKNEVFILPVVKFLVAFIVLNTLNGRMGYMTRLDNIAIVLIVALMCSFLPNGAVIFFAAVFSLLHMYALSLEVAIVGFCLYLVMFLLYFRFAPKDSLVVVLTPLLCALKLPYVMPVVMGLLGTPASAVSVSCGVIVYYLLAAVVGNAPTIGTLGETDATAKLRLMIDSLMANKEMLVMVAAFAITVIVVYLIRRMSVDHAWTIAIIAGVMADLIILLVGDLLYDTNVSMGSVLLGMVVAVICAKLIEFFRFCVDYSRTEKVQFEDDEYYYYVKAVPKMSVAAPTKTVKRINSQHRGGSSARRDYADADSRYDNTRGVVTERTGRNTGSSSRSRTGGYGGSRNDRRSGRSVTISNRAGYSEDDYVE
ncbi:MAG: hypothetical protein NC417_00590 [Candidatus Gastranaerophilales bacterium]|nr:hypothetical protein [Candidatus Gastranaerophilales bacterium]